MSSSRANPLTFVVGKSGLICETQTYTAIIITSPRPGKSSSSRPITARTWRPMPPTHGSRPLTAPNKADGKRPVVANDNDNNARIAELNLVTSEAEKTNRQCLE